MFCANVNSKTNRKKTHADLWVDRNSFIIDDSWRKIFLANSINTFDDLWELKADWFEEPNYRRGGWSGVVRVELDKPDGGKVAIFLKRQENHNTKSFAHPIKGRSTFAREWDNLWAFRNRGIPTQTPLLFAQHKANRRAMLATQELSNFQSLETFVLGDGASLSDNDRRLLINQIANVVALAHENGFRHGSLYPKHLFVRNDWQANKNFEVCFIDLEKTRSSRRKALTTILDLAQLKNRCEFFSDSDWEQFLNNYFSNRQSISKQSQGKLIAKIEHRANRSRRT